MERQVVEGSSGRGRLADAIGELPVLYRLNKDLLSTLDPRLIAERAFGHLMEVIDYDSVALLMLETEGRAELVIDAARPLTETYTVAVKDRLARGVAAAAGRDLDVENLVVLMTQRESEVEEEEKEPAPTLASFLTVPLLTRGELYGMLSTGTVRENGFTEDNLRILSIFANEIGSALENVSRQKTKLLAILDTVTDVYNGRFFAQCLRMDFGRAQRYHATLSLIVLDIDHFRHVNDSYGHRQGDVILYELASILKKTAREVDVVARLDGGEFALLLPQTDYAGAVSLAERLRLRVRQKRFSGLPESSMLTISAGVVNFPALPGVSSDSMLEQARLSLREAKEAGRDRVVGAIPRQRR
jgi:diguanylate cyclase (GGDEF)-like protein